MACVMLTTLRYGFNLFLLVRSTHKLSIAVGIWHSGQLRRTVNPLSLSTLVRIQVSPPVARVAQSVEHFVGNEEVTGSSPVAGSIL